MIRIACAAIAVALICIGCGSTKPAAESDRNTLNANCEATMTKFKEVDPGMTGWFDKAYGYAVFPSVGKGAVGVGGAYGRGQVYEKGTMVGYTTLSQATIGFQLGGQAYSEVIFFKNEDALRNFRQGNFTVSAQVSAVAATAGASADADYAGGVAIFTMAQGGLMYEASVGGQKFEYQPK